MIGYLLIIPVVLVAGYFIARYHRRFGTLRNDPCCDHLARVTLAHRRR